MRQPGRFVLLVLLLAARALAGPDAPVPGSRAATAPAFNPASAPSQRGAGTELTGAFRPAEARNGLFVVSGDREAIVRAVGDTGSAAVRHFPLGPGERVDLEVERFWVTAPGVQFVTGLGANEDAGAFDPSSVILLRGRVRGHARSHVYLALAPGMVNGVIDLGPGERRFGLSSRGRGGSRLPDGEFAVFEAVASGARNPVPFCTVLGGGGREGDPEAEPRRGLRQVQVAVDTDHEFYRLFDDVAATNTYIVQMYGAVSDVFMREINVRLDLTYVRVFNQPNEPYQTDLSPFRNYWNANMQAVPRDVAQLYSGRGDLPGGVAFLNAVCTTNAYSFCGNAIGFFADADTSGVYTYDPMVAAHEFGHNFGSQHTDVYQLDTCHLVTTVPRRGTIMSYCNQTVSGGLSVVDMRFHKVTQNAMRQYIAMRTCAVFDCNQNGVADSLDISVGTSPDLNGNGIPDECEDCNGNGVLDPLDISGGGSFDLNANGVPDECEPDCNGNGIPDDRDIFLGTSLDAHGDNIPDECDADRNGNGVSDYNEIVANMPLDKDRDRIIDATQDCDGDGTPDIDEIEGGADVWVVANQENVIRQYHSVTGVLIRVGQAGVLSNGQDLIITPDRRILVSSAGTNSVVEFDRLGQFVRTLVAQGAGGLAFPTGLSLAPWGNLLVCSRDSHTVLEYDMQTGAFVRAFIPAASGGLATPTALAFGPGGRLFVAGNDNRVREYDGESGAFVRLFVGAANGGLSGPRGVAFNGAGNMLVSSYGTEQVLEYDGATGAFVRPLLVTGLHVDGPWGVRIGPDGYVYVGRHDDFTDTHVTRARIFIFDPRLGNFVRAHVQAMDAGLNRPTGFDFMPWEAADCNRNLRPDSCDIAMGLSFDVNHNAKPDECEGICYANCDLSATPPVLNVADFTCFLGKFADQDSYANCDRSTTPPVLNIADFTCFLQRFAAGCP